MPATSLPPSLTTTRVANAVMQLLITLLESYRGQKLPPLSTEHSAALTLSGDEEELANLAERLDKASTAYGMEISAEKINLMTNNTSGINTEIKVNGQKLETVTSFKYLGSVITNEGSKPEILSRIA